LSERRSTIDIVSRHKIRPFITKDTAQIREILAPGNSCLKRQSLAEAQVAPGKKTLEHYHTVFEEIYYVLRGKGRMRLGSEVREVKAGDGIAIPPGQKHQIENTGTSNLVFLCCCSPAYTHEHTILTSEP
jgi:mannose-6-phosphate isomerase-like protein (cupin superfamily)